jgi:hypothetical protein
MIHSQLYYGIEIYSNTTKAYLDPLLKMNNKILRVLQNKPLRTPVEILYKNYNTLQIPQLRDLAIVCLVHKFVHNVKELPEIYHHYFLFNYEIHDHDTRAKGDLHKNKITSDTGKRNIQILGCNLWNKIPKSIRSIKNLHLFKQKLKLFILNSKDNIFD